jgi:SAM-dependent methyltransferase
MSRTKRAVTLALTAAAVGHLVDGLRLRRRHRRIPVLPDRGAGGTGIAVVTTSGTTVDAATRSAAAAEMDDADLDAIDLVPDDLPAERRLRLLRRVDPRQVEVDPLSSPGGAHEALSLRTALADRLDLGPDDRCDRTDLVRLTVRAQRYAPARTALRVVPGLRTGDYGPADRWAELTELTPYRWPPGSLGRALLRGELAHFAVLAAGVAVAPAVGLAALAAWSAKPALVLGRRGVDAALTRWPASVADTARTLWASRAAAAAAAPTPFCDRNPESQWRRSRRRTGRKGGVGWRVVRGDHIPVTEPAGLELELVPRPSEDELFLARRGTCPWCGSEELARRIEVPDLLQHKPGRFRLDECRACGHIFQNPALSDAGLTYFYDQFYDGLAQEGWERVSSAMAPQFRARAEAVALVAERPPRSWLDVGTGPGHFCLLARQRFADTSFDGLDMGGTVDEAERRGWVDTGHRGFFPDLAEKLTGAYDVVSMHHYLEHTRDPRRELAAARTVLRPGGLLEVEVPDPESPWGRRLGRYWLCWFQPQHLHFVPYPNLAAALEETGFTVVSVERGPVTMGWDLSGAAMLFFGHRLPRLPAPWLPTPTWRQRAGRALGAVPALPALAAAALGDVVKDAWARRPDNPRPGNAYRVVARLNGGAQD